MINIGKKEAVFSYINYFFTAVSNVIVLPIVLYKVSAEEYALWSVFLSLQALILLIDTGFSSLVARYANYAYCGADEIPLTGIPQKKKGFINYKLLFKVFFVARKIYIRLAVMSLGGLILGGGYIFYLARNLANCNIVLCAWILFSIGVALKIYFTYYTSFLKGIGRIKDVNAISIVDTAVYTIVKLCLVMCGWGILGIAIGNMASVIVTRIMTMKSVNNVIYEDKETYTTVKENYKNNKEIEQAFRYNAKQLGTIVICNYLQGQGTTLIVSGLMPLQFTASYSLTLQLINMVVSFANIPFSTFKWKWNALRMADKEEEFKNLHALIIFAMWGIFAIGSIAIIFIVPPIFDLIKTQSVLLPIGYIILLCMLQFVCMYHQMATAMLALGNEQPYVKAYVTTSFIMLLLEVMAFVFGFGLFGFILAGLLTQLAYNGWKWPFEISKKTGVSNREILKRVLKQVRI